MQSNNEIMSRAKCECGAAATNVVAFRVMPRVLCGDCYERKSMRFRVSEEFLIDALTVIARTQGLKATTLDALRELAATKPTGATEAVDL